MNPSSAVTASVVVITASTILRRMREDKQWEDKLIETLVFGFLLLIALLTLAIVLPGVAKILAYLGMVGAFVLNGPAVFTFLGDFGRTKTIVPRIARRRT